MADTADDNHHHESDEPPARSSTSSAVAIPLVALGLLGAAVWLGSNPASAPQPSVAPVAGATAAADPLPSWADGPTKRANQPSAGPCQPALTMERNASSTSGAVITQGDSCACSYRW